MKIFRILIGILLLTAQSAQAQFEILAQSGSPDGCGGSVSIIAQGEDGPYDIEVVPAGSTIAIDTYIGVNGEFSITGFCSGQYELYAVNRFGCPHPLGTITIKGACANIALQDKTNSFRCAIAELNDGLLEISISGGPSGEIPTISWTGPDRFTSSGSKIENLAKGLYTVNVSYPNGCSVSQSFSICCCEITFEADPNSIPFPCLSGSPPVETGLLSATGTVNPSNGNASGSVTLNIQGGAQDPFVNWTGPGGFNATHTLIRNLPYGTYCANISDGCSDIPDLCFDVPCILDFNVQYVEVLLDGCGPAEITLSLPDRDISNYDVTWDDGTMGPVFNNAEYREYSVEINDPNRPCAMTLTFVPEDIPGIRVTDMVDVCPHTNDGEISIQINNPNDEIVNISMNGIDFTNIYDPNTGRLTVGGLDLGDYVFELDLNGCLFLTQITLSESELEKTPIDVQNAHCIYMNSCKGIDLSEDFNTPELGTFDASYTYRNIRGAVVFFASDIFANILSIFSLGSVGNWIGDIASFLVGGPGDCGVAVDCNGTIFTESNLGTAKRPAWEYKVLVSNAPIFNNQEDLRQALLLSLGDVSDCQEIVFCKGTFDRLYISPIGWTPVGTNTGNFPAETVPVGCGFLHYCNTFAGNEVCFDDIFDDFFDLPTDPCVRKTYPVIDLIEGNTNVAFVPEAVALIATFGSYQSRFCADATVCVNKGIIVSTNIEDIDCSPNPYGVSGCTEIYGNQPNENRTYRCSWICFEDCSMPGCPNRHCEWVYKYIPREINLVDDTKLITKSLETDEKFNNLSFVTGNSLNYSNLTHTIPVLVYRSDSSTLYRSFRHFETHFEEVQSFGENILYVNEVLKEIISINSDSLSYEYNIKSLNNDINGIISSSESIELKGFSKLTTDKSIITVDFVGHLMVDSNLLYSVDSFSLAQIMIDNVSGGYTTNLIQGLSGESIYSNFEDNFSFIAEITDQNLLSSYSNNTISDTCIHYLLSTNQSEDTIHSFVLSASSEISIEKISSRNGTHKLLFSGEGLLELPTGSIVSLSDGISIVSINGNGDLLWTKSISDTDTDPKHSDIVSNENGDLYVMTTFENDITIDTSTYISIGGEDLVLVKYDSTGNIQYVEHIGTEGNERIKELYTKNDIVYFGGEIQTDTSVYTLGHIDFIDPVSNGYQRAFVSYHMEEQDSVTNLTSTEEVIAKSRSNEKELDPSIPLKESITHFPNPFTQDITIRIQADEPHDLNILITDIVGRKVHEQNIVTANGTNDIIIEDMKDVPHGVYMVRVTELGYLGEHEDNPLEKNFKIIKTR